MVVTVPNEEPEPREARVEELVGRRLCDAEGRNVGRIEELVAVVDGTDWLVVEVHAGPGAFLERIVDLSSLLPWMSALGKRLHQRYIIQWRDLDLSDPDRPRTFVRRSDLKRLTD